MDINLNYKSINGRVSLTLLLLTTLFVGFSTYLLITNNNIRKIQYLKTKYMEPANNRTFIAMYHMTTSMMAFQQSIIMKDTAIFSKNAKSNILEFEKTIDSIWVACNVIGVEYTNSRQNIKLASQELYQKQTETYDLIVSHVGKPIAEAAVIDSLVSIKYNSEIMPLYWKINALVFSRIRDYTDVKELHDKKLDDSTTNIVYTISVMLLLLTGFSIFAWRSTTKYLQGSIDKIVEIVHNISKGELNHEVVIREDELGKITKATNILVNNLQGASYFAASIGKGDFEHEFAPSGDSDVLGKSLVSMRNELQRFKKEDQERLWITQGQAKFADILRLNNENLSKLCDQYIAEMVNYMGANQGAVFVLNGDDKTGYLELISCYAYAKKKYVEQQIAVGEGLIGQAFLEKDYIYMTKVPTNYIRITSGLGEALPRAVLIMPLMVEEKVYGVMELAFFNTIEKYKIEFAKATGENLASMLLSVKNYEKTQYLLNELREKTESMHSQEEELRQNMEELVATQEEMKRREKDYIEEIKHLKTIIA